MGASFNPPVNLHSPGPIGDVTPDRVTATDFVSNGFQAYNAGQGQLGNGHVTWGANGDIGLDNADIPQAGPWEISIPLILDSDVTLSGIPTSNPGVAGRVWSNLGILTLSAG